MGVATYGFFFVGCHIHVLIEGRCQAKSESALPQRPLGPRIHVDDPAGAQGEARGSRCRMGWTGLGAAGRTAPRNRETPDLKAQAKWMPRRVAVDPESRTAAGQTHSAERKGLLLGLLDVVHGDVQMHLLRRPGGRPAGRLK